MERNVSDMDMRSIAKEKYKSLLNRLSPRSKKDRRMGNTAMDPNFDRRKVLNRRKIRK